MLTIKNGKLYGSNYAFALPQGFERIAGIEFINDGDFVFSSKDNRLLNIIIYFERDGYSAKDAMQKMLDTNCCLVKAGDFFEVKRGEGIGVGLFTENTFGATQHYGERYDFKKNKDGVSQIYIDISLWSGREKDRLTIHEVLEVPEVKAFLNSIEYF